MAISVSSEVRRQVARKPKHMAKSESRQFYHISSTKPSDYTTLLTNIDKVFKVTIPTRSQWGKINFIDYYDANIYTMAVE